MPDLCTFLVNSFDPDIGSLYIKTTDTATFPIGNYQFEFSASLVDQPSVTSTEIYTIEFQDPCLHQTGLTLPAGGPFAYEYTITDDPMPIAQMTSQPLAYCQVTYYYNFGDVPITTQN